MSATRSTEQLGQTLTEAQWRSHFTAWKASHLSKAEYCRQHGLSEDKFYYWSKKLGNLKSPRNAKPFIEVVSPTREVEAFEVVVAISSQFKLTVTLSKKQLVDLIQELSGPE